MTPSSARDDRGVGGTAVLHLFTVRTRSVPSALVHMATDRWFIRSVDGLRFAKLLGTSSGTTFMPQDADLRVWGLFTVWESSALAGRFDASHRVVSAWRSLSTEVARIELEPSRWHGQWSGQEPFGPSMSVAERRTSGLSAAGPIAVLTRARVRPTKLLSFLRAVPDVAADLATVNEASLSGPLLKLGIGEAPIGLQATFSLWPSNDAIDQFAYRRAAHREVVRQTATQGWYAEELFARFEVKSATGTFRGASMEAIQRLVTPPAAD